jgi:membrane-associated phospholipid phosphatase
MTSEPNLRRYTDNVVVAYLLATAGLVLVYRSRLPHWDTYLTVHLLLAGAVYSLRFLRRKLAPVPEFFRNWYPVIAFPFLYKEVEVFAAAFGNWGLTEPIRELETALFAGQPSIYLSELLPFVVLSEFIHFCYLSHVFILPSIGGYWYHTRRETAFRELIYLVSITLGASYLFFILFPVDSPFYLSKPPGKQLSGHFFYELVHFVSDRGGARGGAFPSTHVSITTVIWLVAWRQQRKIAYWLTPIALGLVFATVYGRFHYVLDVIAGLALAGVIVGAYGLWSGKSSSTPKT